VKAVEVSYGCAFDHPESKYGWRPVAVGRDLSWACRDCARRGRRCPAAALDGAAFGFPVLLALRGCRITRFVRCAHCAQTRCGKSVFDARCARPPQVCAARRPIQRRRWAPPAANTTDGGVPAGAPPRRDAGWRWCPRAQAPFAWLRQLARHGGVDGVVATRHRKWPRAWAGERGRRRRPAATSARPQRATERQHRAASGQRNSCN
jgi:hypothetical protein